MLGTQPCDALLNLRMNHSTMDIQMYYRIVLSNSLQFCFGEQNLCLYLLMISTLTVQKKKKNSTSKIFLKTENMKFHFLRNLHYLI